MTALQNRSNFPFCGGFQPLATVPIEKLGQKAYTKSMNNGLLFSLPSPWSLLQVWSFACLMGKD